MFFKKSGKIYFQKYIKKIFYISTTQRDLQFARDIEIYVNAQKKILQEIEIYVKGEKGSFKMLKCM